MNLAETDLPEGSAERRACAALFMSRLSPLRTCFRVVDPRPFLRACLHDARGRRDVCKAAFIYAEHCKFRHVNVRLPKVCREYLTLLQEM